VIFIADKNHTLPSILIKASDGDEIVVENGHYAGEVTVDKSVSIKGSGPGTIFSSPNGCCVKIICDGVKISDCSFEDNAVAIYVENSAGVQIKNNSFSGSSVCCIFVDGASGANADIKKNDLLKNKGAGIILSGKGKASIEENNILMNGLDGILVTENIDATITNCKISGNLNAGIAAIEKAQVECIGSEITNNSNYDLFFEEFSSLKISGDFKSNGSKQFFGNSAKIVYHEVKERFEEKLEEKQVPPQKDEKVLQQTFPSNVTQIFSEKFNITYFVKNLIGKGGQGEVFFVEKEGGGTFAFKKYFRNTKQEILSKQRSTIKKLIAVGAPNSSFLWPFDLIDLPSDGTFGYLMPLRNSDFISVDKLCKKNESFVVTVNAIYNLADNMNALHNKNLAYCDISSANIFYNTKNGDIQICDNDNVSVDGKRKLIRGTELFMAPEILTNSAQPSKNTDKYSLAVLFFKILFKTHPLVGKKTVDVDKHDDKAVRNAFGKTPLFIFNEQDVSNGPLPEVHDGAVLLWSQLPQIIKKLFQRSFHEGLHDPAWRVGDTEWREEIKNLLYSRFTCSHCEENNFVDLSGSSEDLVCSFCKKSNGSKFIVAGFRKVGSEKILHKMPLKKDEIIFNYNFNPDERPAMSEEVLKVTANPNNPDMLGIQNLGKEGFAPQVKAESDTHFTTWSENKSKQLKSGSIFRIEGATHEFIVLS
jgi:eukaryotic-like serine/threonine-protein kinase